MEPPEVPDYYADLGLDQKATSQEIKRAHHSLAKKYHPDKQGPGMCADARDFRRVRAAFEFLRDESNRSDYNTSYPQLQERWARFRTWQETERREELARQKRVAEVELERQMEENRRIAREKALREQKAKQEREAFQRTEKLRLAQERERRERARKLKEALAEQRTKEAAQRAQKQQEDAARERLREQKEWEAEQRSRVAAQKARLEQEAAAKARLIILMVEEKQKLAGQKWARLRAEAELRQVEPAPIKTEILTTCHHPQFGWPKREGKADCTFCTEICSKFHFYCPQCHKTACRACKMKYCRY